MNLLLGPSLKEVEAKDKKLGSIKRIEAWLNAQGENGRNITGPLVGINDLRQGDAHVGKSKPKEGLQIFGIPGDSTEYQRMNIHIIAAVARTFGTVAELLRTIGPLK